MNRPPPHGIVVLGSANVDLVVDVDHRPAAGETLLGSDLVTTAGGKGANQAVAAALLGGSVAFVGCVGDDGPGGLLRSSLSAAGADVSMLQVVDAPTGTAIIMVTPDGNNSIVVAPGANRRMTPAAAEASRARWAGARVLVLQLEVPIETVDAVAQSAAAAGTRVVLNAAPAGALDGATLAVCDPLVVNESEAAALVGAEVTLATGPSVVGDLLALGARSVVVTLGGSGALLASVDSPDVVHVPAQQVAAVDTTGAGDSFVGAVAVALAEGEGLEVAVRWATHVAARSVQRRGAQASYPARADVPPPSALRARPEQVPTGH
ncbi:ribokinase [Cellulomonas fengjieae]|uniref:Ribokinase n=1 Tax=Cellulomonas fengjieae TaxID=2819978 RepID=A0ABS3SL62_9CELL|nr:ribokinase [Cellulomonas fengjieae]MBO3086472.1 ribokinase [Cellulomonas fengjieae]MBO3100468.1 ribokinase [Cellulomonas fengjieae]QVI66664.1 ribokinase [Cellulomonas fengjieae]